MQDFISKGNGNSRYLKSSLASGTTWEQALAQLRAGTFPIDLNGTNASGIQQTGTALNKANLLADTTASNINTLSGSTPSTPNDALRLLASALTTTNATVGTKARIQVGSYVGTGTYGASNPNSLTFDFVPKIVCVLGGVIQTVATYYSTGGSVGGISLIFMDKLTTSYQRDIGFGRSGRLTSYYGYLNAKKSSNGKTVYWYNDYSQGDAATTVAAAQCNASNTTYQYFAIG